MIQKWPVSIRQFLRLSETASNPSASLLEVGCLYPDDAAVPQAYFRHAVSAVLPLAGLLAVLLVSLVCLFSRLCCFQSATYTCVVS